MGPDSEGDTSPEADDSDGCKRLDFANAYDSTDDDLPPDTEGFTPKPLVIGAIYIVRMGDLDWGLAKY